MRFAGGEARPAIAADLAEVRTGLATIADLQERWSLLIARAGDDSDSMN